MSYAEMIKCAEIIKEAKEFTYYNGTAHEVLMLDPEHTHFNRAHKHVIDTPTDKPIATKKLDKPLNVYSTNKEVPPAIDTTGLILPPNDFYIPQIDIPPYQSDVVLVSSRYFWACLHNQETLPPFYMDRLYIPQPVFDHDPDPNHAKYFKAPAKIVGCVISAAMPPYAPDAYVQAIQSGIPVSAASLKSCIMYYTQEKIQAIMRMRGLTNLSYYIDFLQKQLNYQIDMNQNLPDYMFPTPIATKPVVNPVPLNQVIRPVSISFEA